MLPHLEGGSGKGNLSRPGRRRREGGSCLGRRGGPRSPPRPPSPLPRRPGFMPASSLAENACARAVRPHGRL